MWATSRTAWAACRRAFYKRTAARRQSDQSLTRVLAGRMRRKRLVLLILAGFLGVVAVAIGAVYFGLPALVKWVAASSTSSSLTRMLIPPAPARRGLPGLVALQGPGRVPRGRAVAPVRPQGALRQARDRPSLSTGRRLASPLHPRRPSPPPARRRSISAASPRARSSTGPSNPSGSLLATTAEAGPGLPAFVTRVLRAYLRCGVLDHGCLHLRCPRCEDDTVVAFSCKDPWALGPTEVDENGRRNSARCWAAGSGTPMRPRTVAPRVQSWGPARRTERCCRVALAATRARGAGCSPPHTPCGPPATNRRKGAHHGGPSSGRGGDGCASGHGRGGVGGGGEARNCPRTLEPGAGFEPAAC